MAFEPLQTDEKLDAPVAGPQDMDTAMLFGCSGFVGTSIGGYILSVWPFFAMRGTEYLHVLAITLALGLVPAAILGIYSSRKFGLAGACGFVGGAMTTGVFLFLRLQQVFLAARSDQAPTPNYPEILVTIIPLGWVLASVFLGILLVPKNEID